MKSYKILALLLLPLALVLFSGCSHCQKKCCSDSGACCKVSCESCKDGKVCEKCQKAKGEGSGSSKSEGSGGK